MESTVEKIYRFVNSLVTNAHELPDKDKDKQYYLGCDDTCAKILDYIDDLIKPSVEDENSKL